MSAEYQTNARGSDVHLRCVTTLPITVQIINVFIVIAKYDCTVRSDYLNSWSELDTEGVLFLVCTCISSCGRPCLELSAALCQRCTVTGSVSTGPGPGPVLTLVLTA